MNVLSRWKSGAAVAAVAAASLAFACSKTVDTESRNAEEHRAPDAQADTLPGHADPIEITGRHFVNGRSMKPPFVGMEQAVFGMGCFWGAERAFWEMPGVHVTASGYAGGGTQNPRYLEVTSGQTGHAEVVLVVYDPKKTSFDQLLTRFWEVHDPTQGMRQGNDYGSQYRSVVYVTGQERLDAARRSRDAYQAALTEAGHGEITTEISDAGPFYYAEEYHQQYLGKKPDGYCGLKGTGVSCPSVPVEVY
jgi:peptide-methionine (S)-S-oxide reductase